MKERETEELAIGSPADETGPSEAERREWERIEAQFICKKIMITKQISNHNFQKLCFCLQNYQDFDDLLIGWGRERLVDENCELLGETLKKSGIIVLKLTSFSASKEGWGAIGRGMKENQTIRDLELNEVVFDEINNYDEFCSSFFMIPSLKSLKFSFVSMNFAENLGKAIQNNKSLSKLHFYGLEIAPSIWESLFKSTIINGNITDLSIESCKLEKEGAKHLALCLKESRTLEKLFLDYNHFGGDGAKYIAEALTKNKSLENLMMTHQVFGKKGAKSFGDFLKKTKRLGLLHLSDVGIKDEAHFIFEALSSNNSLKTLNITDNYTDYSVKILGQSMEKNCGIISLHLDSDFITQDGMESFFQSLMKNSSLTDLSIQRHSWLEEGCENLLKYLENKPPLKKLGLWGARYSSEFLQKLCEILKNNSRLTKIQVYIDIYEEHSEDYLPNLSKTMKINHSLSEFDLHFSSQEYSKAIIDFLGPLVMRNKCFHDSEVLMAETFVGNELGSTSFFSDFVIETQTRV